MKFDSFTINKIAGAFLGTILLVMGLKEVSGVIYHVEKPEKPGMVVELPEASDAKSAAKEGDAKAPEASVDPFPALMAKATPQAGLKVFKKCKSCHTVEKGGANKVGPNLFGIIGKAPGSVEGYKYSANMKDKAASIGNWDEAKLAKFIANPKGFLSGKSKMTFKLKKPADQANVIAYLKSLAK